MPRLTARRRVDADLHVLTENRQELHQAANRHRDGLQTHERGNLWLGGSQEFGGFGLRNGALLEQAVDLQNELGFQQLLTRVGEAEVGEDVSGGLFEGFGQFFCSFARS